MEPSPVGAYIRAVRRHEGSGMEDGIRLRGYHQNITDTIMFQKEYDAVIQTLSGRYRGILLCDLRDGSYKIIKAAEDLKDNLTKYTDFREFLRGYSRSCIRPEFRNRIERFCGI